MALMLVDRIGALRQAPLFREFSQTELQALAQHCVVRRLRRDEVLVYEGETAAALLVLASGTLRAYREGLDGREQVLSIERPVSTLNEVHLFDTCPHATTIAAAEDATIFSLPFPSAKQCILRSGNAAATAMVLVAERLRASFDLAYSLGVLSVEQRLAQFLLDTAEAVCTDHLSFDLRLSNGEIGAVIGAVREVVSRAFGRLQDRGLITLHGRAVVIESSERLRRFVCSKRSEAKSKAAS